MEWNQVQSTHGGTAAVFANEGQWNTSIEDIGKRNGHDGPWDMGKRRVLRGRKWMGQRTRGLDEMEPITSGS